MRLIRVDSEGNEEDLGVFFDDARIVRQMKEPERDAYGNPFTFRLEDRLS